MKLPLGCLITTILASGCLHRFSESEPPPLRLQRPATPLQATPCALEPEPAEPSGHTPPPLADGALSLLEVRGEDRLALPEQFAVTWSHDSQHLITATREAVLTWSVSTGELLSSRPHGSRLESAQQVLVGPPDDFVAVLGRIRLPKASSDLPVLRLLRLTGSEPVQEFTPVGGLLFLTADGRRALSQDHAWDLTTGAHTILPRAPGELRFLPDGHRAIAFVRTGTAGQALYTPTLWDVDRGAAIHAFEPVRFPQAAALSGDGRRIAILRDTLQVFSTETFERLAQLTEVPSDGLLSLSHDGRRVVVSSITCVTFERTEPGESRCPAASLTLWDVDGKVRLAQSAQGAGHDWEFTGDERYLTGPITRWVDELLRVDDLSPLRLGFAIRSVSPDGRYALSQTQDAMQLEALGELPVPQLAHPMRVLARSPDGHWSARLDAEGLLQVQGPASCVKLSLGTPGADVRQHLELGDLQLEFSPDAALLMVLTSLGNSSPHFRALDTVTGAERWSMQTRPGSLAGAHLGGGEVWIQGNGLPELLRFDASSGELTATGQMPRLSYEVSTAGPTIEVRDVRGTRVNTLWGRGTAHSGEVLGSIAFFADDMWFSRWDPRHPEQVVDRRAGGWANLVRASGKWWAVGHRSGGVRLFGERPESERTIGTGHTAPITSLLFTRDARALLSASEDGTVSVSSVATGERLGHLRVPYDGIRSMWLSPDGAELRVETARGLRIRLGVKLP